MIPITSSIITTVNSGISNLPRFALGTYSITGAAGIFFHHFLNLPLLCFFSFFILFSGAGSAFCSGIVSLTGGVSCILSALRLLRDHSFTSVIICVVVMCIVTQLVNVSLSVCVTDILLIHCFSLFIAKTFLSDTDNPPFDIF